MRRLNETELDARIHSFLDRKFAEFPELAFETDTQVKEGRHPRFRDVHPRIRWGTAL